MTTAIIGAAGRIGSAVARRLFDAGETVRVLVRDPGKGRATQGKGAGSSATPPMWKSSRSH